MTNIAQLIPSLRELRNKPAEPSVCFFPPFSDKVDLNNHYHRASWYLPYLTATLESVYLFTSKTLKISERPDFMAPPVSSTAHINVLKDNDYLEKLANSSCVLLWNYPSSDDIALFNSLGIKAFNVTTNDESTVEYGNYCKTLWQITDNKEKNELIKDSHDRFIDYVNRLKEKNYKLSVVFGTGPSIDLAESYDFSQCFTHVCNTIIESEDLMAVIQPDFISAGDVVSHFGVSVYAYKFRERLFQILEENDLMFLTTSQFGYLFMVQYPSVAHKVLICDQRGFLPNYDMISDWSLPCLDSVFNIHMAPTASTMNDVVLVLGCDGKNPDEKLNEDFWQHSKKAQLHDLVDSGHQCHPTFDIHRQKSTWVGYQNSVQQTCGLGENLYKKTFYSLAPSFTIGLSERYIEHDEIVKKFPFLIKKK